MEKLKFIDLFAGIGGFRIAMESFNGECVFSSEWDKYAQQTYKENFGELPEGDITKIEEKDIPSHDVLLAGFPCQAFSISGKQRGFEDTRGTLFFDVARIIKYHKPKYVFLENVKNFEKHDGGRTLEIVKKTLNDTGYIVYNKVLNAGEFGLAQNRKRIFIVAIREDMDVLGYKFPEPCKENVNLAQILEPEEKINGKYYINRPDIYLDQLKIESISSTDSFNKPIKVGIINKGGQGERIYSPQGHAITLSAYGGGAASKTGGYLINNKVRKLTPRECARLQGFPEKFKIVVSDAQAWKQFGNSLPINIAKQVIGNALTPCTNRETGQLTLELD